MCYVSSSLYQSSALFSYEDSIYNWTYHALGGGWSFFVGVCAWLSGALSIVTSAIAVVSCLQALNTHWLLDPWQQGLVILIILLFAGLLSVQRTRMVQHVLNVAAGAMGLATILIRGAAIMWLLTGHRAVTTLTDVSSLLVYLLCLSDTPIHDT